MINPLTLDKTKPLTDAEYAEVERMTDKQKAEIMYGFDPTGWSQKDKERHYKSLHYPNVKYYSSGGGGQGTVNPPKPSKGSA